MFRQPVFSFYICLDNNLDNMCLIYRLFGQCVSSFDVSVDNLSNFYNGLDMCRAFTVCSGNLSLAFTPIRTACVSLLLCVPTTCF